MSSRVPLLLRLMTVVHAAVEYSYLFEVVWEPDSSTSLVVVAEQICLSLGLGEEVVVRTCLSLVLAEAAEQIDLDLLV